MMAWHTKSSSHEHSIFGFGLYLCKAYRCFVSRCHPDKKHTSSNKHRLKSFDEACKEANDRNETRGDTNDLFHVMRSHKGNEFETHDYTSCSPKHNSNNQNKNNHPISTPSFFSRSSSPTRISKKSSLFRSVSHTIRTSTQTQTQSKLMRSLTRESVETKKPNNVGSLKRSSSSHKLETKILGKSGSMAHSGPLLRSASRKDSPEIMHSNLEGLVKLLAVEQNLDCTLEELCFGCVKRITVARNIVTNNGQITKEPETLPIKVKPGWTKGTKIAFEGIKNEEKGTHSCDVNFVINEKKHTLYRREGDDLELVVKISLLQALSGCTIPIPLLGGEKMNLTFDEIIVPGYEKIIEDQGMPKSKDQGHRGNLKLTFLVDFPTELTEDRKSEIVTILQDSC